MRSASALGVAQRHAALLADELRHAAAAGRHDRHSGAHRLQHRERRELVAARAEHERGGAPQQRRHLARATRAEQLDGRLQCGRRARPARRRAGPSPAIQSGTPASGGGLDREVEPLLGRQPPGGEHVAALVRPRAPGQLVGRQVVGEHVEPVAGHAEACRAARPPSGWARRSGRRSRARAAGAAPARRRRRPPRAASPRQLSTSPGIVLRPRQRKQGAPSRAATPIAQNSRALWRWSTTRAPAERAAASPRGPISGCMLCAWTTSAAARAPPRRPPARPPPPRTSAVAAWTRPACAGVALQQPVLDPRGRQRAQLKRDRALLPALEAIAVVEQQYAGVARCAHQAGLRYRPRWTRPWCQSWSPRAAGRRISRSRSTRCSDSAPESLTRSSSSTTATTTRPPTRCGARPSVRYVRHGTRRGLNAARNTGLRESRGAADRVRRRRRARSRRAGSRRIVEGAERHPDAEAFGGPIRARFEGRPPRGCGREQPPITTLDLGDRGPRGRVRLGRQLRGAPQGVERVGPFDESIIVRPHGDEEEWLERLRRRRRARRLPRRGAGLDHRRTAADARLRPLARAAYARGRARRASDRRRGREPSLARRAARARRAAAGTRCGAPARRALIMGAHSAGRARGGAAASMSDDFLSGDAGDVEPPLAAGQARGGRARLLRDRSRGAASAGVPTRSPRATPPRRVLVAGVYRPDSLAAEPRSAPCARGGTRCDFALRRPPRPPSHARGGDRCQAG